MGNSVVNMKKPNGSGIGRIYKAFYCSMKGFKSAYIHEAAFRQELILCLLLFPTSFFIASTIADWLMLVLSLLFLLFAEIINSALEALADRISLEHHELLGRAKDLGSAGVFIAMLVVILTWSVKFYFYLSAI